MRRPGHRNVVSDSRKGSFMKHYLVTQKIGTDWLPRPPGALYQLQSDRASRGSLLESLREVLVHRCAITAHATWVCRPAESTTAEAYPNCHRTHLTRKLAVLLDSTLCGSVFSNNELTTKFNCVNQFETGDAEVEYCRVSKWQPLNVRVGVSNLCVLFSSARRVGVHLRVASPSSRFSVLP